VKIDSNNGDLIAEINPIVNNNIITSKLENSHENGYNNI